MNKPKLLIIDDDEAILNQMKWALTESYDVFLAGDRRKGLDLFRRELPPLVTLDMGLPPYPRDATEGLQALSEILEMNPNTKVLVVSGNADHTNALQAVEQGAYDFFKKPIEIDEIQVTLRRALNLFHLEAENRRLKKRPFSESGMLGSSRAMEDLHATIRKIGNNSFPVLITGESGTGKELVAQAIHQQSDRADKSFVAINCGAIPENLMESELFGHEKGAFTGAHAQRKGRLEFAEGGTLFLDEIGELGLGLQVKLLRFLQEKTLERVGGRKSYEIDARVLAATNRNLKELIKTGDFREDLYYRLSVVSVVSPPLRDREGDLLLLAQAFIDRFSEEAKKRIKGLTKEAVTIMTAYAWPGNVRELENKIKRAVVMADGTFLTAGDLGLAHQHGPAPLPRLKDARDQVERELAEEALTRFGGNITHAASALGISRQALHDIISKHHIERPN
ncbi:MAG: PEP-CTERM-box response regulator transcription factor [Nitrospiria bacterium]